MKTVKYLVEILDDAERILSNYADYAEDADYLDEMADGDIYIIREMEQHENEIEKIKTAFEKFWRVNCPEPWETEDVKILVANDEYIRAVVTTSGNTFDVVLYADGTLFDREMMGTKWTAEFLYEGYPVTIPAVEINDMPYLLG